MNMKRLLLSLICCSPLLLSPSVSFSIDLTGPSEESPLTFEQYGPISPVETLWGISTKLRPDTSVTVQQTLVAIYKTNPYAFFDGDINKIIPQSVISVPSLEFVQQQTNAEAIQLIQKFTRKKKAPAKVVAPAKQDTVTKPIVVEPPVPVQELVTVDPILAEENALYKEKALEAEQKIIALQDEVQMLNEQFIVATESTQALKLKLQPLNDQITTLSEQLEAEMEIQAQLQQVIDDYRAQLDAIEPAPFSGDGMLNKILHLITSSLTNLLIVLLSPIILLLLIYAIISRIRSKRELAEKEQELAESTAILMEESGQFDSLLTDDITDSDNEVDFSAAEIEPIADEDNDLVIPDEPEAIDLTDELDTAVVDLTIDDELITEIDLDENEPETDEDDPFGISALTEESAEISEIELADDELETNEDDPFGISALNEESELMPEVDLSDGELDSSEDDPFGISALTDELEENEISDAEQADLDLAAEWEAQVSADNSKQVEEDASVSSSDIDDLLKESSDSVEDEEVLEVSDASSDELEPFNLEELESLEEELALAPELTALDSDSSPAKVEDDEDLFSLNEQPDSEDKEQQVETNQSDNDDDRLAQQISDVAFNEEVDLPEVGDAKEDDFIDIETLLENSGPMDKDEPYSELELDLGLEEFPDVVDLQDNIDIDDDENGIGAQLDLARAYLEIDDKEGAKEILMAVVDDSNGKQREEIDKLLSRLS
jgi:pilus assembly protein FimV